MARCMICGDGSSFDYECEYCEGTFCNEHHLPERHNCVYLGGAKTLGPEFRHLEDGNEKSSQISESEANAKAADRQENRETTGCEGCGETIDARRTYCPQCRLELADLDEADGPKVVMEESPEPESLAERSRTVKTEQGAGRARWITYTVVLLVAITGVSVGLFIL